MIVGIDIRIILQATELNTFLKKARIRKHENIEYVLINLDLYNEFRKLGIIANYDAKYINITINKEKKNILLILYRAFILRVGIAKILTEKLPSNIVYIGNYFAKSPSVLNRIFEDLGNTTKANKTVLINDVFFGNQIHPDVTPYQDTRLTYYIPETSSQVLGKIEPIFYKDILIAFRGKAKDCLIQKNLRTGYPDYNVISIQIKTETSHYTPLLMYHLSKIKTVISKKIVFQYMNKLLFHSRQIQTANHAIQNCENKVYSWLSEIRNTEKVKREKTIFLEGLLNTKVTLKTVKRTMSNLRNISRFHSFTEDQHQYIIETKPIYMQYHNLALYLGKFKITVGKAGNEIRYYNTVYGPDPVPHPHVYSDGKPCLGLFRETAYMAMETGEIDIISQEMIRFLFSFTPGDATASPMYFDILTPDGKYRIRTNAKIQHPIASDMINKYSRTKPYHKFMKEATNYPYSEDELVKLDKVVKEARLVSFEGYEIINTKKEKKNEAED